MKEKKEKWEENFKNYRAYFKSDFGYKEICIFIRKLLKETRKET